MPVEEALAALAVICTDLGAAVDIFEACAAQAELVAEEVRALRPDVKAVLASNGASAAVRCLESGRCAPLAEAFGRDAAAQQRWARTRTEVGARSADTAGAALLTPPPLLDERDRAGLHASAWADEAALQRTLSRADTLPRDTLAGLSVAAGRGEIQCLRRGCDRCAAPRHEGLLCNGDREVIPAGDVVPADPLVDRAGRPSWQVVQDGPLLEGV